MAGTLAGYDPFDALGTVLGVYLALAALATLVGMPWQYTGGAGVMVLQVVGCVLTFLVGAALLGLVYRVGR
ncbi:hypothetical protein J2752_001133 [Halarchaeum rubridurum]|uniref:DUF8123 domain-containing protein n=1 Tax=Halarchaeum rubridurum TaxID=489911 RepID=A0A830FTF2_9EURY|nr:hypothetical protein [Halarchaeum rubridurum]MBP1954252.1 hypothetical protein [Halarchaeum rubridurum]GGM58521.1 hypothetical protein GCM10009017_05860 [Halarchaeum rubridurum]